ncbi:MAG TPA: hypothetical protein DCS55_02645 [Acidimicrobiaceae bacterium]|nr:hypothetical protein [Acidimicrobiaceae bacterium]
MKLPSTPLQAVRFARGLRTFLRQPIDRAEAIAEVQARWCRRDQHFLDALDRLVWPIPESPHRKLLAHAGLEPPDVAALVTGSGLEPALETLRDEGVYVAYEEYTGHVPARRGSATFEFSPPDFANPLVRADYIASSGGTRSTGTASGSSFHLRRERAKGYAFLLDLWEVADAPTCVWLPALPGSAGLSSVLSATALGTPPERWFSPTDPSAAARRKRIANGLLPPLSRLYGRPVPAPVHVPVSDPGTVLSWCLARLATAERVLVPTYTSAAVALAQHAIDVGATLEGVVLRCGGEPLTAGRRRLIEQSGAAVVQVFAFSPSGMVAASCLKCRGDEMHLIDHDHGVIQRRRTRPDGVEVDALLWTSLLLSAGQVLLNTENDDYGEIFSGPECGGRIPAACGRAIRGVRGMSKVVAGGTTLHGEALERLVDEVLPQRFGGSPAHYQFAESNPDGAATVVLRVAPAIGPIDGEAVVRAIEEELRLDELGTMALGVWTPGRSLVVERSEPVPARSGKTLPFQALVP